MKIAALLTCYNRVETTLRCLKQLVAQQLPKDCLIDIYLVDDASPDHTGDRVQEWFDSAVGFTSSAFSLKVIRSQGNLFWCKGMRLAWDMAITNGIEYDFWLWLNDDIQLNGDAIKGMLDDFAVIERRDGKPGIVVGAFSQSECDVIAIYGVWDFSRKVFQPKGTPTWVDGETMNGNLVLIPKVIYKSIGPICNKYFHGYGDSDYRMMAKKAGYRAYCVSKLSGVCPRQPERYIDVRKLSFVQRLKYLNSGKSKPLYNTFIYRYRHWGLFRAMISCCHVVCITLFQR